MLYEKKSVYCGYEAFLLVGLVFASISVSVTLEDVKLLKSSNVGKDLGHDGLNICPSGTAL